MISERTEKLLIRYMDSQTGMVEDLMAVAILRISKSARDFVAQLRSADLAAKTWAVEQIPDHRVDLWQRIERRIAQEQHAAVFLGERKVLLESTKERPVFVGFLEKAFNKSLFGGMAVGVATAAFAFVIMQQQPSTTVVSNGTTTPRVVSTNQHNVASGVEFVSAGGTSRSSNIASNRSQRDYIQRNSVERNYNRAIKRVEIPFEVDWMKSDGQVRFIQDPRQGSTVIWVKRNSVKDDRPVVLEAEPKLVAGGIR